MKFVIQFHTKPTTLYMTSRSYTLVICVSFSTFKKDKFILDFVVLSNLDNSTVFLVMKSNTNLQNRKSTYSKQRYHPTPVGCFGHILTDGEGPEKGI